MNQENLWQNFADRFKLTNTQINQFKKYWNLIKQWNKKINLTNIIELPEVISYHFEDSLSVSNFYDFKSTNSICDIGTGGGFPGIPLKIKYPHLSTILIEVTNKKIEFLEELINELNLENIKICSLDWRTFLRKTEETVELFLSRASLHTDELVRVFQPNCFYNNSTLIYWGALNWVPTNKEMHYLIKEEIYQVGSKKRKLIFFKKR